MGTDLLLTHSLLVWPCWKPWWSLDAAVSLSHGVGACWIWGANRGELSSPRSAWGAQVPAGRQCAARVGFHWRGFDGQEMKIFHPRQKQPLDRRVAVDVQVSGSCGSGGGWWVALHGSDTQGCFSRCEWYLVFLEQGARAWDYVCAGLH